MSTNTALKNLNNKYSSFDDKYELVAHVGRGKGSVVYKALRIDKAAANTDDQSMPIALKILTGTERNPTEAQNRIHKETRALVSLNHPNIIKAYNYVARPDCCYISMEYADHGDLAKVLANTQSKMSINTIFNICKSILLGLDHIHANNIIHRDIKLENILLTKQLEIKLTDFSAALLGDEKSDINMMNRFVGTLEYVAPECLQGKPYSTSSDIYAAGVVLYKLLTGFFPFDSDSIHQSILLKKAGHIKHLSPELRKQYPNFPQLIQKFLAPLPEDRFTSAKDAISAIEDFKKGKFEPAPNKFNKVSTTKLSKPVSQKKKSTKKVNYLRTNIIITSFLLALLGLNYNPTIFNYRSYQPANANELNIPEINLANKLRKDPATGALENLYTKNHHYYFSILPYDEHKAIFNLGIKPWESIFIDLDTLSSNRTMTVEGKGIKIILRVENLKADGYYYGEFHNQVAGTKGTWKLKF